VVRLLDSVRSACLPFGEALIAVCDDIDPWKLWADERLCTASE
jgi:hypothetical protein